MPSDAELYRLRKSLSCKQIAAQFNLNVDSVRRRANRYKKTLLPKLEAENEALRQRLASPQITVLEPPISLKARFLAVAGDIHLSTVHKGFVSRFWRVSSLHMPDDRELVVAGDFINADAFSDYELTAPVASFGTELAAARVFFQEALQVFPRVHIIMGNHDRRVQKKTRLAIMPDDLLRLVSGDPRIQISIWGHLVAHSDTGEWRITHGSQYSVNQLTVASEMALKFQQHIISHHEHHLGMGFDRFKRYVVINNGGLFDREQLLYSRLDDTKNPNMANGFTLLRDGYPAVFGEEPFTRWSDWLDIQVVSKRKAKAA
jgi:hypothetical protein